MAGKTASLTVPNGKLTYGDEWNCLIDSISGCEGDLHKLRSNGLFQCNKFRSVYWRSLSSTNVTDWIANVNANRKCYEDLLTKYQLDPRMCADRSEEENLAQLNPLSLEENSPWQQWFSDRELKSCIEQDVERTFPELEYFHSTDVRGVMVEILFLYARLNAKIGYKQGMHEILAPILFVLYFDQQSFAHAIEIGEISIGDKDALVNETLNTLMRPNCIAADAYDLFARLMSVIQSWYCYSENSSPLQSSTHNSRNSQLPPVPFARPQDSGPSSSLVRKLNFIGDKLLKEIDPPLYKHLEDLEIAPQIYGIRWLRLLFGREFPIQDLLAIWDEILIDGDPFMLVDYIYVAMLEAIRDILLVSDYSDSLNYLMKFPPVSDVQTILRLAYHYYDPVKYPKPQNLRNLILTHTGTQPVQKRLNIQTISNGQSVGQSIGVGVKPESIGVRKSPSFPRLFPRRASKETAKFYTNGPSEVGNVDYSTRKNLHKSWVPNGNQPGQINNVVELMKEQIGSLQTRLDDVESISFKVADRINKHTEFLTQRFSELGLSLSDPAYQSIVELKQMSGTLRGLLPSAFEHLPIVAALNTPVEIGTDATAAGQSCLAEMSPPGTSAPRRTLNFPPSEVQLDYNPVRMAQDNELKELHHH